MKIYNTLTNKEEEFVSIQKDKITIYICGPTVYNNIHIGNARPLVVFDTVSRYFKYKGYDVTVTQNFTDIDDKMIAKANEENTTVEVLADKYINEFFKDTEDLNISKDIKRPRATEYVDEMIDIIKTLENKGYAYESNGNVFFDIEKYKDYGELSNQKLENLDIGNRIEIDDQKKSPYDFVLWKNRKEGEPYWSSPWGEGRPGWHTECAAMSNSIYGESFDIHGGGEDLKFPHHENEIAQAKCAYGGSFAKYWMHNGYINIDGEKMSKSKNNFFLLKDVLSEFSGNVVRLFLNSTHYRKPINFSKEELESTEITFKKLHNFLNRLDENQSNKTTDKDNLVKKENDKLVENFQKAMDDDFNTPKAIGIIFEFIKEINKIIDDGIESKELKESKKIFKILMEEVLGVKMELKADNNNEKVNKLIELLISIRKNARDSKNYELSDKIRDELNEMGIELKDNSEGKTTFTIIK